MTSSAADGPALLEQCRRVIEESRRRGLTLRVVGSVAIRLHVSDADVFARLGRPAPNDLDLVGRADQRNEYKGLFRELGYKIDRDMLMTGEGKRFGFELQSGAVHVDLFIDRLEMCHTLELRERLELNPETASLADLLLQKLQIIEINRKDLVDIVALLGDHHLGDEGRETIDLRYICQLLADDWGFFHTVTQNLEQARGFVRDVALDEATRERIDGRLVDLASAIDEQPKTRRWKLRARIGTRRKWYQDVGEGTEAF